MEFVDDIARKTGQANLLVVEAAKASRALEIGKDTGLFSVPKVVNLDAEAGVLEFERLSGLETLLDLAVRKDRRLPELLEKAGRALAAIHAELTLPQEMKHELQAEWMNCCDDNVFIHGDFACVNVCFHDPSDELVILDFSAAPMVGRTATFGSRYFDILLFMSSLFHGAPYRSVLSWDAGIMAGTFLRGYVKAAPRVNLNKLKDNAPKICRLQRKNMWHLSRQRAPLRAVGYILCQMLMYVRFCLFLRKCGP
ncbi:MAG: hypothetical protein AMJ65_06490 [Phycisphaerae bacterium SG8_4]|nr:MAG: hypothetical protein AMJ65_06490 [Phycisphaerae bacterium SG8_4]